LITAGPQHAGVLGRLLHDFNVEFESPTPSEAELTERFAVLLGRKDQLALLAGTADDPTGFAYLTLRLSPYYDGPVALLEELYVVPHLRDQGVGTALLTEAIEAARGLGSEEMQINVDEVDTDTRRFYERHGFVNVEPGTDYRMLFYTREL
jgi:GNAT superfamily N-acetyltransferase